MEYPKRKYPRANFHDYNCGDYFVTVSTHDNEPYFGSIRDNEMHLSELGKILHQNILSISKHFKDVEIPLFVVMPNHFHAIICIDPNDKPHPAQNLGTLNALAQSSVENGDDPSETTHHNARLSVVVGNIKSHVTREAHKRNMPFKWLPRFYERIIRGPHEGNRIAEYIECNVARWSSDQLYQ